MFAFITVKVTYRGGSIAKLAKVLHSRGITPEFKVAFAQISKVFARFIQARFLKFSKGGGNWRRLRPSTIRRKGHALILRDTDTLKRGLNPVIVAASGVLSPGSKIGWRVSYGVRGSYPSGTLVERVADFHHRGRGRLPSRKIIVGPDINTAKQIAQIVTVAIQRVLGRDN